MVDFDWKKFFLLAVSVAVALFFVLWCVPPWQVEQVLGEPPDLTKLDLAKLADEYRRTLAQSIGAFFILVGLYISWRRVAVTEENVRVAQKNVRIAQENVRVAQEGQVTERFTQAIKQLGDCSLAIRLGGIYALERIAKDSEKDHGPVMEVLTAYVRVNAPRKNDDYQPQIDEIPPTDIQAILTVIGRRKPTEIKRLSDRLDLSNTHLVGAMLNGADLRGVVLYGADLREAVLHGADLDEADLRGANLNGVDLHAVKNFTEEQIRSARDWGGVHWPDSLKLPTKPPS